MFSCFFYHYPRQKIHRPIQADTRLPAFFLLILSLTITACSSQPPAEGIDISKTSIKESPVVTSLDEDEDTNKLTSPPPDSPSFKPETLYSLILAEIAAQRNRLDVSLSQYVEQAHETRDPGIIARANRIARYMGSHKASLNTATLWTEVKPKSIEARQVVITELLYYRRYEEAIENIDKLLDYSPNLNFDHLIENAGKMTFQERANIIEHFKILTRHHANSASTWFTYALLLRMNNQLNEALSATETALEIEPVYTSAMITKGKILNQLGHQKQALKWIKKSLKQLPDNNRLRVVYARMLIEDGQYKNAQEQFSILVENSPNNGDLILSLAILSLENKLYDQSEKYLKQLIHINQRTNDAWFFLGELYQSRNLPDQALEAFKNVKTGSKLLNARARIAKLLVDQNRLEEARQSLRDDRDLYPDFAVQLYLTESSLLSDIERYEESLRVLSEALQKHPDNSAILYSRAMLGEKLDQLDLLESDLKTILKKDPNNAMALNALGYTLADRTQRLDEAFKFISRAIELSPNDPAIMDSMGWLQYRMGNYEKALSYLQSALILSQDDEIAAHLGEVLWVSGDKTGARKVWKEALKLNTESKPLKNTMEKFDPE